MTLAIVFTGAVRECLSSIRRNITELVNCYKQYNPEVIFSTWLPVKDTFMFAGINFAYDYDLNAVREQTKGIIHTELLLEQDLKSYHRNSGHNGPITPFYQIKGVAEFFKRHEKVYDYVVLSRHDNQFKIKNVEKYFNDKIWIPPIYWNPSLKYSTTDVCDHFWIMPYKNLIEILSIPEGIITNMCRQSYDNEQFTAHLVKHLGGINFINDEDILTFINREMSHRRWRVSE